MKNLRVIGNTIKKYAEDRNISLNDLADHIGCTPLEVEMGILGRSFFSFSQMRQISDLLCVDIDDLIPGDEEYYNCNVVDCVNRFSKSNDRENILDIIYDYLDVVDDIEEYKQGHNVFSLNKELNWTYTISVK